MWQVAATAAAVSAVIVGYAVWRSPKLQSPVAWWPYRANTSDTEIGRSNDDGSKLRDRLVVRDIQSLQLLSRLTKTNSLTSLHLPRCSSDEAPGITLCSGTAWMEKSSAQRERGYVVALAPGCQMDLYVYTDAAYQNGLGVVELDDDGRMTGGALSFSNLEKGDAQSAKRRVGSIGNYSEFNDRSETKYYLLTGSHRLPEQAAEEMWHLSDFKVQYDSGDLMVIGWDDSGYIEGQRDQLPDRDYNNVRAVLRFSRPGASKQPPSAVIDYSPDADQDFALADEINTGYTLDVKPGEMLALLISSSAELQNSVRIVDVPSRRIIWQCDGSPSDSEGTQAADRGVYVIRNYSATVRRYEIQAQHAQPTESGGQLWQNNPYQVVENEDRSVIVGFEDSISVPANVDWNDIRVYARWFSD